MVGPIVLFILVLALTYYLRSPSVKGAIGEARVDAHLNRKLGAQGYQTLRDLTLRTSDGTTQIDHVVVSRFGVFVVETKNMSGWIFGSANQARWTQTLPRHKSQFQNPLRQNYKHVQVIREQLGLSDQQVHNVVVFVGSAVPKTAMPGNVLWSNRELSAYIETRREKVLTEAEVDSIVRRLKSGALEPTRQTRRDHVQYVKAKAAKRKNDTARCPKCGSPMVERANRKTGDEFLGCSRYPKCRGTRKLG